MCHVFLNAHYIKDWKTSLIAHISSYMDWCKCRPMVKFSTRWYLVKLNLNQWSEFSKVTNKVKTNHYSPISPSSITQKHLVSMLDLVIILVIFEIANWSWMWRIVMLFLPCCFARGDSMVLLNPAALKFWWKLNCISLWSNQLHKGFALLKNCHALWNDERH